MNTSFPSALLVLAFDDVALDEAAGTAVDAGGLFLLLVFAIVSIGFSFLCSIAEAVLLCVTPSYIATKQEEGHRAAPVLARMKQNIDRPLSAILSLNTIAHTVGAAGVGAQAAALWGSQAVGWASALMTILILVLSEIIPKTIGAVYWRGLAPWTARLLQGLILILYPLVWMSELLTKLISGGKTEIITREEVAAMAALSSQHGELESSESLILANLFRLPSLKVQDIMTPRTVVIAFPEDLTVAEAYAERPELPVSRVPVYDETIDKVTGFVLRNDILLAHARGDTSTRLSDLRRDLKGVPANASLTHLFDLLLHQREHIALVVDEYGGTDGLVTMEDLLETLLGMEIVDEADTAADMQRIARRRWEERARTLGLDVTPTQNSDPEPERGPRQADPAPPAE